MAYFKAYSLHVLNSQKQSNREIRLGKKSQAWATKNSPCILHTSAYNRVTEFIFPT